MVSHLPRTANQNPVDRLPHIDPTNRRHLEEYVRHLKLKNLKNTTVWIKVWIWIKFICMHAYIQSMSTVASEWTSIRVRGNTRGRLGDAQLPDESLDQTINRLIDSTKGQD